MVVFLLCLVNKKLGFEKRLLASGLLAYISKYLSIQSSPKCSCSNKRCKKVFQKYDAYKKIPNKRLITHFFITIATYYIHFYYIWNTFLHLLLLQEHVFITFKTHFYYHRNMFLLLWEHFFLI